MSPAAEPFLHVDMDAFFASVESRDDPSLAGLPVVVGSAGPRGVVASASYEARAFGVHSAMPSTQARRLCPEIVFVSPDFRRYSEESDRVMEILRSYTPLVEPLSLDEAFLDVSGAERLFGSPEQIAHAIRARVRSERRLVCSVGVAPNKFLAKLASGKAKPDGVLVVRSGQIRGFLDPLPVEDLWGVGEKTAGLLRRLGARTVGELASLPRGALAKVLGPSMGDHLLDLARGIDDRAIVCEEPAKQVSAEDTFERDIDAPADVRRELLRLSERVGHRLRKQGVSARTVTIKVRFSTFRTVTRSRTLSDPTNVGEQIFDVARGLYDAMNLERPRIRLLGVACSGLASGSGFEQMRVGEDATRWSAADRAMDRLRGRFGPGSVERAALADRKPVRGRPGGSAAARAREEPNGRSGRHKGSL